MDPMAMMAMGGMGGMMGPSRRPPFGGGGMPGMNPMAMALPTMGGAQAFAPGALMPSSGRQFPFAIPGGLNLGALLNQPQQPWPVNGFGNYGNDINTDLLVALLQGGGGHRRRREYEPDLDISYLYEMLAGRGGGRRRTRRRPRYDDYDILDRDDYYYDDEFDDDEGIDDPWTDWMRRDLGRRGRGRGRRNRGLYGREWY